MVAYRQPVGSLILAVLPALNLNRCPFRFQPVQILGLQLFLQRKHQSSLRTRLPMVTRNSKEEINIGHRSLELPDVNPYAVIASELVAKESAGESTNDALLQRAKEYIHALKDQLEPVCSISLPCSNWT